MNDFSEIENELKRLRPSRPSEDLAARIECALAEADRSTPTAAIVTKSRRFHFNLLSLGLGLAAAAAFLVVARINMDRTPAQTNRVAQNTPVPQTNVGAYFIPTGATQVVYQSRDEGLHFTAGSEEPMRRMRYQTRDTLQWRNPNTGASLQVSYPSEEVVLTPVSGQ